MSEQKRNVRDEPWAKNAPEYMVEAIALLVEGREEGRAMLAMLNARESTLSQREEAVVNREQIVGDREAAFVQAAADMKSFVNRIYGPDSELTQINARLADLPRVDDVSRRLDDHERRLDELERKTA